MPRRAGEPLAMLLGLQERMNRLFAETLERLDSPTTGAWTPVSDLHESAEAFVLHMELPGLTEDEVELEAETERLTVRGERRPLPCPPEARFQRAERSYGRFARTFRLGAQVDPEGLRVRFEDGLLTIEIPKAGKGTPRPR